MPTTAIKIVPTAVKRHITNTVRRKGKEPRKLKTAFYKTVNKKWKCEICLGTCSYKAKEERISHRVDTI